MNFKQAILETAIGTLRRAAEAHGNDAPGPLMAAMANDLIAQREPIVAAHLERKARNRAENQRRQERAHG